MNPPMGTIYNSRPAMIEVVFTPKQLGILNNDWHIPCYIQNASQPIFLKLNAVMKSMNVEFRRDEKYVPIGELSIDQDLMSFSSVYSNSTNSSHLISTMYHWEKNRV